MHGNKNTQVIDTQVLVVISRGLEPRSKEPESSILSIELRNQLWCKDNKKIIKGTCIPFIL